MRKETTISENCDEIFLILLQALNICFGNLHLSVFAFLVHSVEMNPQFFILFQITFLFKFIVVLNFFVAGKEYVWLVYDKVVEPFSNGYSLHFY